MSQQRWRQYVPKWQHIHDHRSIRMVLFVALGVMLYLSMLGNVAPTQLKVDVFSVAEQDIISPDTVRNQKATEAKKAEAAASVEPVYTYNEQKKLVQIEKASSVFTTAKKVIEQSLTQTTSQSSDSEASDHQQTAAQKQPSTVVTPADGLSDQVIEQRLDTFKQKLSSDMLEQLSKSTLTTLVTEDAQDLMTAKDLATTTINKIMSEHVTWDNLSEVKNSVPKKIPSSSIQGDLHDALIDVIRSVIVPNYTMNTELTKQKRQNAMESVEPVMIREGQIIVKKGEVINRDIMHQLKLVGLLDEQIHPYPFIGLGILVMLLVGLVMYYLGRVQTTVRSRNTALLLYIMIVFITLVLLKLTSFLAPLDIYGLTFIVPAAVGTILIKMLMNERLAVISSMIFAVCGSLIFNDLLTTGTFNVTYGLYILFSCLAGVILLRSAEARPKMLQTGLGISVVNVLVVVMFLLLGSGRTDWLNTTTELGFAFLSGFIAVMLVMGLLPFFEAMFGILSTTRLIELSNPNHPLLRKILTEAPGTYHHSVMVANLAESACEAIGCHGLLARVAAYYHDVGKTKRPQFFIENQMGEENPHDYISPYASRDIIIDHPYDGAAMLRDKHIPKEIIDIAEQHHGTTLLQFFYHKAKEQDGDSVTEAEFRYPGPKAQTKVTAVVEMSDSVEAAVKSLKEPTQEKIENLVRKIISSRVNDGQFDDCDITLKEIETVTQSICETLKGTYHTRIEYPDDEETGQRR